MVKIDYTRDSLFDNLGLIRLRESYMRDDEKSPQERFAFIANAFGSNSEHAQRIYDYASKHWLSFATPILSFGRTKAGLPISCYLPWLDDTSRGLVECLSEVNWLSMLGGGVGIGVGIRSSDEKSTGVLAHLKVYDASSLAYRQGTTRRGSYAVYLDISHPDIIPFIEIRKETGDPRIRCENLHNGINIPDSFMQIIERCTVDKDVDDSWPLIDPHSKKITQIVSAKMLWQKILDTRMETGEPYIHFIDTSNHAMQPFQRELGLSIRQSNLCTEIILPTNEERTAVCCLSSLNLEYVDDWRYNELFLKDVAEFLDNILSYFIRNAPKEINRARNSAINERSIGIGALGLHAYFQKNNIPFESISALSINRRIFKHISEGLHKANLELGAERGEAPDAKGTGRRFSNVMAIAPNASSSIIVGNTSPSIEPFRANIYTQETLSGKHPTRNKYLDKLINEKFPDDYDKIWESITANEGSIQHLDCFDEHTKNVFKTAMQIDQKWIIQLAADRQAFIDQSQSINLFFFPNVAIPYLHMVHFLAWKKGLKTLYYCRSEKLAKADKIGNAIERKRIEEVNLKEIDYDECMVCAG